MHLVSALPDISPAVNCFMNFSARFSTRSRRFTYTFQGENMANKINSSGTPTAESVAPKKKAEKKAASSRSVKAKKTADTSFETAPKKTKAVKKKAVSQKMKTTEKAVSKKRQTLSDTAAKEPKKTRESAARDSLKKRAAGMSRYSSISPSELKKSGE